MFCTEMENKRIPVVVINIGGGAVGRMDGAFSFARLQQFIQPFGKLVRCLLVKKYTVYLTIAQSWNGFLRDSLFILFSSMLRSRVVVHLHGGNYDGFYRSLGPLRRLAVRHIISKVNVVIVLSESLRKQFYFLPNSHGSIKVVHNGLPDDPSMHRSPKTVFIVKSKPLHVLYLSNMIESKGYLLVLKAIARLVAKGIPVRSIFCGEFLYSADMKSYRTVDEARTDFFSQIEIMKLKEVVEYRGAVAGEEKRRVLEQAHFFVLPTSYINEGQPLSIIEAMAYGCVVISTNFRSIPEMLDHGNAGIILEKCGGTEIAETISNLIVEPDRYSRLSIAAQQRFDGCFSKEAHIANMLNVLLPERMLYLEQNHSGR